MNKSPTALPRGRILTLLPFGGRNSRRPNFSLSSTIVEERVEKASFCDGKSVTVSKCALRRTAPTFFTPRQFTAASPKVVALENRSAVAFVSWARDVFTAEELSGVHNVVNINLF